VPPVPDYPDMYIFTICIIAPELCFVNPVRVFSRHTVKIHRKSGGESGEFLHGRGLFVKTYILKISGECATIRSINQKDVYHIYG
jgi:hypothetical protein